MKKIVLLLHTCFVITQTNYSQNVEITGNPIAEIHTNFHKQINDTTQTTGFGLTKAYLGYQFLPSGNFSGTIIVNIGNPEDLCQESVHRRYANFREASIKYSKNNLDLALGITSTRLWDFQQKYWGKRYIANTFQSLNGYGFVADMGIAVDYKFNDILKADFTIMNGEGSSELQLNNSVKTSVGFLVTPDKQLTFRIYGDIDKPRGIWQTTLVGFTGYKNELMTIGAEADYKANIDIIEGHNAWGFSGTGAINILKNTEIFVRYDYSTSFTSSDNVSYWKKQNDGNLIITGFQYIFTKNVKVALNYQGTKPYNTDIRDTNSVYVNALFKF
jgi:hypothetical protein